MIWMLLLCLAVVCGLISWMVGVCFMVKPTVPRQHTPWPTTGVELAVARFVAQDPGVGELLSTVELERELELALRGGSVTPPGGLTEAQCRRMKAYSTVRENRRCVEQWNRCHDGLRSMTMVPFPGPDEEY